MKRIALVSEHASPLATVGGVDSGGQNIYVACVARQLARLGHAVDDGIVIALAVFAAGAASGGWLLATAGFVAWFAITAGFCACRLRGTILSLQHIGEMIWTSILIPPLSVYWRLYGALKFRVAFI